jgi:hypothetical protein
MFKRILLTLTFIAAFSAVGIGVSNQAQAWRGGYYYGRPYGAYYAPSAYYYGPAVVGPVAVPYRAYYAPRYIRPYYYYATPAYPVYYNGYYPGAGDVNVSIAL